jgi:DNA-binding MarR family transcriptional regulator
MSGLTEAQQRVLRALNGRWGTSATPTGPEISDYLGHAGYWASGKLASLERRKLVERLGQSSTGGICYRITPAGRQALEAKPCR